MPKISSTNNRSESRYYTSKLLRDKAQSMGCCLRFARSQGVFELSLDNPQDKRWTWVMRPGTEERVRLIRELTREEWDVALRTAKEKLLTFKV